MNPVLRFWGAAAGVAMVYAVAAALLLPYGALGLDTEAERWRGWLLTLWTGGVLCVLYGLSGLLGYGRSIGFRDVSEAGSVTAALEQSKAQRRQAADMTGFHGNFAWWVVSTGLLIILVYFVGWGVLGV